MNHLQNLKQFVIARFSRKNAAIGVAALVLVTTAGLFIPNQERVVNADSVVCSNGPTNPNVPHLNTFPVRDTNNNAPTQNADGTYDCYDYAFMAARKNTGTFKVGTINNVVEGDIVQVRLYIHNTAPANGPASSIANNVAVTTSFSNGTSKATINASADADNLPANENGPSGTVQVDLAQGQSLQLIDNSGQLQHYDGTLGRTDLQIGNNTVTLFPTLEGCFDKSKFVYYKFRVVQNTPPQQGDLNITKEVRNVTSNTQYASSTTARVASGNTTDTVQYRITVRAVNADVPNVTVTDTLPSGIVVNNDLTMNGSPVTNGTINSTVGLNVGTITTSTPRTFVFTARVTATQCNATLQNTARATSGVISRTATATVTTQCQQQPPVLVCAPRTQNAVVSQVVSFTATGGIGVYAWSAAGGNPASGNTTSNNPFTTRFVNPGTYTVTVTSGTQSSDCTVNVRDIVVTPLLTCVPGLQTIRVGETANFSVNNAVGIANWSAPTGSPATGVGSTFSTAYNTTGTKTVTVTAQNGTATCSVFVNPIQTTPDVVCAPSTQTVNINQTAFFTATNGNGTYAWTANGGEPSTGNTRSFSTRYATAGTKTVTVASAGRTSSCTVIVRENQQPNPVMCTPDHQETNLNTDVTVQATGGNGVFSWSAPTGSPAAGNGTRFTTKYNTAGNKTITVTSNGRTDTCTVLVKEPTSGGNAHVSIVKSVRNISDGTGFENSVNAEDGDRVQFEIIVRSTGSRTANNVVVTDNFPNSDLTFDSGSVRLDGSTRSVSSADFSISLGSMSAGEQHRIIFDARVNTNRDTTIRNEATVTSSNAGTDEDEALIFVDEDNGGGNHHNNGDAELQLFKKVRNDRTGQEGTNVTAQREDFLTYTLTVRNTGDATENNFVIRDDLSGILAFADIVDLNGAHMDGQTIVFPSVDIRENQTVTKTFRVRVKFHLTPEQTYVLQNTYGNLVTVTVPGTTNFVAPKTGSSGTSAAVFAGLLTSGFVIIHKRQQLKNLILA